tara:strand:- start:1669 stop:2040 length:372 start_codon:yes stop_codon:yes gene_type:complete
MSNIHSNLDLHEIVNLLSKYDDTYTLILYLTASWCGPCTRIKPYINEYKNNLKEKVIFVEIDVDETLDVFGLLKKKKQLNGIPAILKYKCGREENDMNIMICDECVLGSKIDDIRNMFASLIN